MENVNNNNNAEIETPVVMSEEEILNFESNQKEQKEDVASELSEEALAKYKEVLTKLEKETDKHKASTHLLSNVVAGVGTGLIMSGIARLVYNILKR